MLKNNSKFIYDSRLVSLCVWSCAQSTKGEEEREKTHVTGFFSEKSNQRREKRTHANYIYIHMCRMHLRCYSA